MDERLERIDLKLAQDLYEIVEANVKKILNPEIGLLLVEAVKKQQAAIPVKGADPESIGKAHRWSWPIGFR